MKKALITGITGQDGSYLTEYLLQLGYEVHGVRRRSSSFTTWRIDSLIRDRNIINKTLFLHDGDMTDSSSLTGVLEKVKPIEIYNLAAQSHVGSSFLTPHYTSQVNAIGTLNLLESVRILQLGDKIKIYQASTSEMFGNQPGPQSEKTPFNPISPYGLSKLYAHELVIIYRKAYGLFASNGILFNHESSRRGGTFVTQKIVRGLLNFKRHGIPFYLGNLDSARDWGHAKDYVQAMHAILSLDYPVDLVVSTDHQLTIRQFVDLCANKLEIELCWNGSGLEEKATTSAGKLVVGVSAEYFRPTDVLNLQGDSSLARRIIAWEPTYSVDELINEMIINNSEN